MPNCKHQRVGVRLMQYHCVESTADFELGPGVTMRLWVNEGVSVPDSSPTWLEDLVYVIREAYTRISHPDRILEFAATLSGINAVQVLVREEGVTIGRVIYTVPFEGHG